MTTAGGSAGVGRAATGMGVAAAASRVLGGARVLVVAAVLGTTYLGDAFEGANALPTVVFELLAAGALSAVLVPTFTRLFDRGEVAEATRRAGGLLGVALLGLGTLAVLGIVFAPAIADILVSSGSGSSAQLAARQDLTTTLLRFFLPQLVLYPFGFLAIALLNARRVFALPAAAPIANTIVVVTALLIFWAVAGPDPGVRLDGWEIAILGLGGTLGVAAFVAVPTIALRRQGVPLRPRFGGRDPEVVALLRLSGWAVLQHSGGGTAPRGRDHPGCGHRGRGGRLPGRLLHLPGAVRDPRPADPHGGPPRARGRGPRTTISMRSAVPCAGRWTRCRWSSCRHRPPSSRSRLRR